MLTAFPPEGGVLSVRTLLHAAVVATALAATARTTGPAPGTQPASAPSAAVRFEPNVGQTHPAFDFLALGGATGIFLGAEGAVLRFAAPDGGPCAWLRLRLPDADPAARAEAREPLPSYSNHFRGRDPARWRSHVPHFAEVVRRGVLPGIDVVWHSRRGRPEFDFELAPGADPSSIRLAFDGAQDVRLTAEGDVLVALEGGGEATLSAPAIWQDAASGRRTVAGRYAVTGREVRFDVGAHDAALPLVIDPSLEFTRVVAGALVHRGPTALLSRYGTFSIDAQQIGPGGLAVDAAGAAFVVGYATSTGFPVANPFQGALAGGGDATVSKLAPTDGSLVYATYFGGADSEGAGAVALDAAGGPVVVGWTASDDFPIANAFQTALVHEAGGARSNDVFVARFAPAGDALVYSTYLGGSDSDVGDAVAVDGADRAYVGGHTTSTDLPIVGGWQTSISGATTPVDGFVARVSADGRTLERSTYLGGTETDGVQGRALGAQAPVNATGSTRSPGLGTPGAVQPTFNGSTVYSDGYVASLTQDLDSLAAFTYVGGTRSDQGTGIAVDSTGALLVCVATASPDMPTTGALQPTFGGPPNAPESDAFVALLGYDLDGFGFATYFGGSDFDVPTGIAVAAGDEVVVAGMTMSPDLPYAGSPQRWIAGGIDAFAARYARGGQTMRWATYLGSEGLEVARDVAVGTDDAVYVAGGCSQRLVSAGFLCPDVATLVLPPAGKKKAKRPGLAVAGVLDTGQAGLDPSLQATLRLGTTYVVDIPSFVAMRRGRLLRYVDVATRLDVRVSPRGGSKARFLLKVRGDLTGRVAADGDLALRLQSGRLDANATIRLAAGSFRRRGSHQALRKPTYFPAAFRATLRRPGRDDVRLVAGFAVSAPTPDIASDLHVAVGNAFDVTIPAGEFVRDGDRWVFAGDRTGVRSAVVDYARERVTVVARGVTLGRTAGVFPETTTIGSDGFVAKLGPGTGAPSEIERFAPGRNDVRVLVGLAWNVQESHVIATRRGAGLRY